MLTPTQTLQKMLERVFSDPIKSGEKGKEQDNPKLASTSKTPTQNSESDIKTWCLSSAEKSGKPIFERLAKVDGMKKSLTDEISKKFSKNTADQNTVLILSWPK